MFCLFQLPSEAFILSHLNSSGISNRSSVSDSSILICRTSTESHLLNHDFIRLLSGQNLYWTTICLLNKVQIISLTKYPIDSIVFWPHAWAPTISLRLFYVLIHCITHFSNTSHNFFAQSLLVILFIIFNLSFIFP